MTCVRRVLISRITDEKNQMWSIDDIGDLSLKEISELIQILQEYLTYHTLQKLMIKKSFKGEQHVN